jgi:cellulose synthase/poly-beta-1,6-N-acetylglucosamine synthase-like glycosyltransferase
MPTVVLDIDFQNIPSIINDLENYEKAFVLLRVGNQPVAQIRVPVRRGRLYRAELLDLLKETGGWRPWEQVLHQYLGWESVEKPSKMPKATVAVTTRDRPEDLKRCLDALSKLPDDGQEYLVIDNCPATDATKQLVDSYRGLFRYVREDRVGASAARNRALREAKHEIVAFSDEVAFSDDDAMPDRGWLRSLIRNFCDPLVLCVTGLTMPLELETKAQEWFELYSPHGRGFSRIVFDGSLFDALNVAPVGVSANIALRRTVVEHVGFFDEALGPGTPAKCGEDYELFSQILRAGYRIVYDPAALSWHRHRRTWRNFRKTIYGYGVGVYAFWTRSLLVDKEWHTLQHAWWWFRHKQLPNLVRSLLRRPDRVPLVLLLAELWGCIIGPGAYFVSRWRLKQERSKLS